MLTELIVTGSRLRDPNVLSANPLSVIEAVELEQTAPVSLESVLERTPGAAVKAPSGVSSAGSQGDGGFVDLHQLGFGRTLVLINGRRAPPTMIASSLGAVTANVTTIPLAMIDRVEILQDGASPVYGTDAIGGVLNVVLRDSFEGVGGSMQIDASEHGDRESGRVSAIAGGVWERGDFMVGLDYNRREPAFYKHRSGYGLVVNDVGPQADGEIGFTSTGRITTPYGIAQLPTGELYTFTAPGVYRPYVPSDNVPVDPNTMMAPGSETYTLMPVGRFYVTDTLTAFFEGMFTHQETTY